MSELTVVAVALVAAYPATLAAILLAWLCLGLLTAIVVVLAGDRHDRFVRVVAVAAAPPAPPARYGPEDRPLVNPRFAAHIAAASAEFAAATRAGRHVVTLAVDAARGPTAAGGGAVAARLDDGSVRLLAPAARPCPRPRPRTKSPRPNSGQQLAPGATPAVPATSRPTPPPPDSGTPRSHRRGRP